MTEPEILLDSPIEIVEQLRASPWNKLPVDAIRAAQRQGEAIVPHLVELLQQAIDGKKAGRDPEDSAYIYALFLLAEFERHELLAPLLELLALPEEGAYDLISDCVTEDVPNILAVLVDSDHDVLDKIIRDPTLDQFVRWSTAAAYPRLVADGKLSREEAVGRLEQHLRWALDSRDEELSSALVFELERMALPSSLPLVEEAFANNLVKPGLTTLEYTREQLDRGDLGFEEAMQALGPSGIEDTVAHIEWWATYQEEDPPQDESSEEYAYDDGDEEEGYAFVDDYLPSDTIRNESRRIGRNEPCPCQSGKKYKKCCGKPL